MFRLIKIIMLGACCVAVQAAGLVSQPAGQNAKAYLISPRDGVQLSSPFKVVFGLSGMGVAPAGVDIPDTGHHHLLVNVAELPPANLPIPADDKHLHFGKGQTETVLSLPPGQHTLQIVMGDRFHVPHKPPVASKKVTITVVAEE